jgi:predicted nucleic acid-binding protein
MNAIDTNILVYALDHAEPAKQVLAERLLDELIENAQETILLWQVAIEVLAYWRKCKNLGKLTESQVRDYFDQTLKMFPVRMPSIRVLEISFQLQSRFSLSHWDSLLIAACQDAAVERLYSEDMQHGANYDGVIIINPFL